MNEKVFGLGTLGLGLWAWVLGSQIEPYWGLAWMKWLIPVGDGRYRLRRRGELAVAALGVGSLGLAGAVFIGMMMGWGDARPAPFVDQTRMWCAGISAAIGALYFLYLLLTMQQTLVEISFKSIEIRSLWFARLVALYPFQQIDLLKVGLGGSKKSRLWEVFFFDPVAWQRVVLARLSSWDRAAEAVQELAALTGIPYALPPKPKEPVSFRLSRG